MNKEMRAIKNYLFGRELKIEERGSINTVGNVAILPLEVNSNENI